MPPSLFLATLAQSLAANGTETEVYLSTVKTLTGETITTSQFATLGRGILTVDPLSSANVELISFTGVDATGVGFTGATRGLSALSNAIVTENKKYHPAGTTVLISFGVHNLLDLQTYITGLVSGSLGTANDTTAGSTKVTYDMGSAPRAKIALVSQSGTGTTSLLVNPFSFEYLNAVYGNLPTTANPPVFSTVSTGAISAPTSNPRIDLIVWATSGGTPGSVAVRTGTEGASPVVPTPNDGDIILCSVFHRVGQTKILERDDSVNGYILQWYEPTVYLISTPVYTSQAFFGTDQSQTTSNATYAIGEANATGKHSIVAQKFVPTVTGIRGVKLWKIADTGTFTGSVKVALQADSSGSPSGTDLASYTISNAAWLSLNSAAAFTATFSTEYDSMTINSPYWIVITPSTSDNTNHPNLGYNNAGGYASGVLKYNNFTDGWVTTASADLYFKTVGGSISRFVETSSADGLIPVEARPYSFIAMDATNSSVTTNTETTMYSVQLEGGLFTANSGIKVRVYGTATNNSVSGSTTVKVKFNGSALATIGGVGSVDNWANKTTKAFALDFIILNQSSTSSQKYQVSGWDLLTGVASPTFTVNMVSSGLSASGTTAVDTSAPGVLSISFTNVIGTYSATYVMSVIEKIG